MADVLTAENDLTRFSFPIAKSEDTDTVNPVDGTPDIVITGKVSDGTLDSDLQVVDPEASLKWIKTWHATGGNIRQSHDAKKPVGVGLEVDGHTVTALIAEPTAKHLVRTRVLKDFSIGIMHPDVRVGDPRFKHLDPAGHAVNGVITDRPDGLSAIGEISIVDRGSNYGSRFQIAKATADGSPEFVGKMLGAESGPDAETLEKAAKRFSPTDLAKILAIRARAEEAERAEMAKAAEPGADEEGGTNAMEDESEGDGDDAEAGTSGKGAEADVTALAQPDEVKALLAAEGAVYKRDIDAATRKRLAAEGRALPNLSYPIETHEDADNAVTLALSGHGDVGAAKSLIRRVAKKEGWSDILERLDGKKDDASKAAKPKMRVPCPNCKKGCKAGAKFCAKCGTSMSADKSASPGDGVTGEHTESVPAHREPDGTAMELLEDDAHLEGGNPDEASEEAADAKVMPPRAREAMTGKSAMDVRLRHEDLGVGYGDAVLHDLLCPAYDPADVAKCYEDATIATQVDPAEWQDKALEAAANAPVEKAAGFGALWESALALKAASPDDIADITAGQHAAFLEANKLAAGVERGLATFPVPTELSPTRFNRPYISAGTAATPQPDGSHHVRIITGTPEADDFGRGFLTAGAAADSPSNEHAASDAHVPSPAGKPQRTYYRATARERAENAMRVLHDHIAETHPDLCPMHGPGQGGQPPHGARPVPAAAGKAAFTDCKTEGAAGDGWTAGDGDAQKAAAKPAMKKPPKVPCPSCGKKCKPTAMHCSSCGGQMVAKKSADTGTVLQPLQVKVDPDAIGESLKAAVAEALAPVNAELAETRKALASQQELIDQMASDPDPRYAPFKGVATGGVAALLQKAAGAGEQEPDTIEKAAQRQQAAFLAEMQEQIYSGDPAVAEAAWAALNQAMKLAGAPARQ